MIKPITQNDSHDQTLYGIIFNENVRETNYLLDRKQLLEANDKYLKLSSDDVALLDKGRDHIGDTYSIFELLGTDDVKDFLTGGLNYIDVDYDLEPERFVEIAKDWTWCCSPDLLDGETKNPTMLKVVDKLGLDLDHLYGRDPEFKTLSKDISFELWQIKRDLPDDIYRQIAFESLDNVIASGIDINTELYEKVYEGQLNGKSFEDLFYEFNMEIPNDFRGHSMSMSDVITLWDNTDANYLGSYYVDDAGFKHIPDFMTAEFGLSQDNSVNKSIEADLSR